RSGPFASTSRNYDELPAVYFVDSGRGVTRRRQGGFPEQFPGCFIESSKLALIVRGANENQAARGDHRTAVVFTAGIAHSLGSQLGILSQRRFPGNLAGIEIDRIQCSPWRLHCGVSVRVEKLVIAVVCVGHVER